MWLSPSVYKSTKGYSVSVANKTAGDIVMVKSKGELPEDSRYLDYVDDIIGSPNLLATLELLSRWGFCVDPILSTSPPVPVKEQYLDSLKRHLGHWTIAYFAMVLLRRSNQYRRGTLNSDKFVQAINYYYEADEPPSDNEDQNAISFLTRLLFQQLPYQREWWSGITRAQFMYGSSHGPDEEFLAQIVSDIYGMSYNEVLSLCLSIYFVLYDRAASQRECSFTLKELTTGFLPWIDASKLTNLVRLISQTQQEFRGSCQSSELPDRSLRKYDFNPLLSKPLIRIGDRYYAPVPMLLPVWATEGIAYALSSYAVTSGYRGEFGDALGHAFENSIAKLLSQYNKDYVREKPLRIKGQHDRPADFIVVENKVGLIFDCKSRRVQLKHREGCQDAIQRDYEDIVKALEQDVKTTGWIRQRVGYLGNEKMLAGVEKFIYAVVTMDEYYLANSSIVQRQIARDLGFNISYQVISARELELLLCNLPINSLITTIEKKAEVPVPLPTSYSDYLHYLKSEKQIKQLIDPPMEVVFSELHQIRSRIAS